jgi:hypothetical protein
MIVWGGQRGNPELNTGGRYNPATDSWTVTSIGANLPVGRDDHTAVWTGTEMIVWGGVHYDSATQTTLYLNSGGRYDPASDTWTATSTGTNVPVGRHYHTAVWTGTTMIVWGGGNGTAIALSTGGRYTPATDSWIATSTGANVPGARKYHAAVWTGTEMIVWGGWLNPITVVNTGGRYDPSTDSWSPTSTGPNLPVARAYHTAVWTGTTMIVWGGTNASSVLLNTGGRYDPSTDAWTATSTSTNVPAPRYYHSAVWAGTVMVVWGGVGSRSPYVVVSSGGRYDPATDVWTPTSAAPGDPSSRAYHAAVWTGTEMIVWGGCDLMTCSTRGGRYDPASDVWTPTSIGSTVPSPRWGHKSTWTGAEMIAWGGNDDSPAPVNSGGRYDPATDNWTPTSVGPNVPAGRTGHTSVWTGREMIVWGGGSLGNTGGRYDPVADAWAPTSVGTNTPTARFAHTAVWTGTEMIVWGGGLPNLNTGGRYDPRSDSWVPTSTGPNVPAVRYNHTAVWTGKEMIVWGGDSYNSSTQTSTYLNSGGRYDPTIDMWTPTSIGTNAPGARNGHQAVWTGMEMIVWGGANGFASVLKSGGRYSPSTDMWRSTSMGSNCPSERQSHTAVWTGSEMIVWSGQALHGSVMDGGRYNPVADTWAATSTGANVPGARSSHTAVWTGTEMIVWGGAPNTSTGGRYCACPNGQLLYRDADGDGYGNAAISIPSCDGAPTEGYVTDHSDCNDSNPNVYPGAAEVCNGIDDNCNGLVDDSASGEDTDGDGIHDLCDDCPFAFDPSQCDFDHDGQGDVCDLNDGLIFLYGTDDKSRIEWQAESGPTSWNVYTGDLAVLKSSGIYTQSPGSNSLASRQCGLADVSAFDPVLPDPGSVEYSLVTGVSGGIEGSLGTDGAGIPRPNANPCP